MRIGLRSFLDYCGLELSSFGKGRFGVSLTLEQTSSSIIALIFLLLLLLGLALDLLEDMIELLIGRLVIGMVSPMSLQKVLTHLQLLLNIGRD